MRRTTARSLRAAGAACLAAATLPLALAGGASAAAEPGSGFSSFSLAANAPAMQVRQADTSQCGGEPASTGGCEGVVPEAVSTLRNGPVGYGLAAVVWPGTLAGNLGSLIIVAGGDQVPPEARQLNSPIRAEARTGNGDALVENTDYPGARMAAQATATKVTASATVSDDTALPVGTAGQSSGTSTTQLTGPTAAVAEARSHVKDVSLAGVVTFDSVTSTARATTDGTKADATGSTSTTGAEIAGVPVTIDERGVTVDSTSSPANTAATAIVNSAIAAAGMTIAVSEPTKVVDGGTVSYDAGSLVFVWEQQPGMRLTAILGGARVTASAAPGFSVELPPGGTTGGTTGTTTGVVPPPTTGTAVAPPPAVPGTTTPVVPQPAQPVAAPVLPVADGLAGPRRQLPDGLSPGVVALGLTGAGLFAAGMRRLPDRVLETAPTACPDEEPT